MRLFHTLLLLLFGFTMGEASAQLTARGTGAAVRLVSHEINANVEDGLARTTLRQTFTHEGPRSLEAIYRFPLPAGARLVDVVLEAGGERLEGLLAERRQARRVYDDIVRSRRDPALVEQVGARDFRLSVFPVVPGELTVVELTWIQHLPLSGEAFHYALPLGAPGARVEGELLVSVAMRSSVPLESFQASASDFEAVRKSEHEVHFSLERCDVALEGDLFVEGRVSVPEPDLAVRTFRNVDGDGWFLALWTPPALREHEILPRDIVMVIDTSGSMRAEGKLEHAKRSARHLLAGLRAQDRVNILRFSSEVVPFADQPVALGDGTLPQLEAFVDGLEARGGTALGEALQLAARTSRVEGRVQMILLLTDGQPTVGERNRETLVGYGRALGEQGLRVFSFGVGTELDTGLLRGIAAAGRGEAELFRLGGEIEPRLERFLRRTGSPAIAEVELAVDGVTVYGQRPRPIPDGYLGEQIAIVGRYRGGGTAEFRLRGTLRGQRRVLTRKVDLPTAPHGARSVAQLYAHQQLGFLEGQHRLRLGLDDKAYYKALDEGAYSTADEIVEEMIRVSLEHRVQCAHTAFIALLPEDRQRLRDADAAMLGLGGEAPVLQDIEIDGTDSADSPFDATAFNSVIGIGGGAGGAMGGRFLSDQKRGLGEAESGALEEGLNWLTRQQGPDGFWPGGGPHDLSPQGNTAACVLALMGSGSSLRQGPYKRAIVRGIKALRSSADPNSGAFLHEGAVLGPLDQARVTLALVEAYYFSKSPLLRQSAQRSLKQLGGVYQESLGSLNEAAAVARGWIVLAFQMGRAAGLKLPVDTVTLLAELRPFATSPAPRAHRARWSPRRRSTPAGRGRALWQWTLFASCRSTFSRQAYRGCRPSAAGRRASPSARPAGPL